VRNMRLENRVLQHAREVVLTASQNGIVHRERDGCVPPQFAVRCSHSISNHTRAAVHTPIHVHPCGAMVGVPEPCPPLYSSAAASDRVRPRRSRNAVPPSGGGTLWISGQHCSAAESACVDAGTDHCPYVSASFGVPHCAGSATAFDRVLLVLRPSWRHMPAVASASVKYPLSPNDSSFQCTVRYKFPVL